MKMCFKWMLALFCLGSCKTNSFTVTRIALNMPMHSIFGLPLESSSSFVYPCFEGNVYRDTINDGIIKIVRTNEEYSFFYIKENETIEGSLKKLPFETVDYNITYNFESLTEDELKIFKVVSLIRDGEWLYTSNGRSSLITYKTKVTNQDINVYCK